MLCVIGGKQGTGKNLSFDAPAAENPRSQAVLRLKKVIEGQLGKRSAGAEEIPLKKPPDSSPQLPEPSALQALW